MDGKSLSPVWNRRKMEKFASLKYDFVFREVFSYESIRKRFISDVTGIPLERIRSAALATPFLLKRHKRQKLGIMDIAVILNDSTRIDIELQVRPQKYWVRRNLFYLAKMYTEDLKTGQKYELLKKCVTISILDFSMVPGEEYHTTYTLRDRNGKELTDLFEIHIIELGKRPQDSTAVGEWVQLFNAGTLEEMDMIRTKNAGIMEAVEVVRTMNLGKMLRMEYEARLKAKRDRWAEDDYVRDLGRAEGRAEGVAEGRVEGRAEGVAEGKAASVLKILGTKGKLPDGWQEKIMSQTDMDILDQWLLAAAGADSLQEFQDKAGL